MIILAILALSGSMTIIGPGTLSGADPGVLERVAERRLHNGWGLHQQVDGYDVLIAPPDCKLLGRSGYLVAGGRAYSAVAVDCEADVHRGQMVDRGLLADVNERGLWHKEGYLILR